MVRSLRFFINKTVHLFVCIFTIHAFSQDVSRLDSLADVLTKNTLTKEERINTLLAMANSNSELNLALISAKQALKLAIEIENPILQAESFEEISLKEFMYGNNSESLKASLKALEIYESLNMLERQAASYTQLANNYISDENYKLGILYLKKAKNIYRNSDKSGNLILTIHNLGEAYRLAGHLDSAETSFKQTLKLNRNLKDKYIESYTLGNLGMVYTTQNKLKDAKVYLNSAIAILSPLGDSYSTSVYMAELGKVENKEGKFKIAEYKFKEALSMAKQSGLKEQVRDFSGLLTDFYESQGQYAQALEYQKLYQIYQDSLVNKETIQKIEGLKAGYEINKRESEIDLLNTINTNQKQWVTYLAIGTSLLIFFTYLLFRANRKNKLVNETLSQQKTVIIKREEEKTLLLRELNHRIKNNLQMISSLLNLQSRELTGHPAKEAILAGKHRVEALSLVHRKLYQEGLDTRIQFKDYIEELVLGLFHGYNAQFKPSFKIDNVSIGLDKAVPLALVVNELIINSLKYAYKSITNPLLKVIIKQHNHDLDIQIIDNGIGFNMDELKNSNSFGIKLINSLTQQLEGDIKKVYSKSGTHWVIQLKIK